MVFGKQSAPPASAPGVGPQSMTRERFLALVLSVFVGLMLLLTLGGCGSGSGGGNNNGNNGNTGNTGNTGSTTAIITGRVVNQNNNNAGVAGATVSYGATSSATDNSGNFSLTVPSGQATTALIVVGPANADGTAGFYNTGYVGANQYSIATTGFPVTTLSGGETRNVGTIIIFSTTGPPPPPIFN